MYLWLCLSLVSAAGILCSAGLEDPKDYVKNSSLQWDWALQAIENYPWSGTERVLDIGCGDGKISALIAEQYTKAPVVGLDLSNAMIRFASSSFCTQTHSNLLFQEGDISLLPFYQQFDLIVSFCSLHYVVEPENGLTHIYESLRPGGKFLFVVPGKDDFNIASLSETLIKSKKWAALFPVYKKQRLYLTQEEQQDLLAKSSFELIYFNLKNEKLLFSDQESLINWLRPLVNFTSHLSYDLREEFLKDLSEMMLISKVAVEDNTICLGSILFECLCERR